MGEGVEQNYEKAVEYYELGVEYGDGESANSLGYLYEIGEGVEQDYDKAIEY